MQDHHIQKQQLFGQLYEGEETLRSLTYSRTTAFEEERQHRLQAARDKRHRAALIVPSPYSKPPMPYRATLAPTAEAGITDTMDNQHNI